LYLDRVRELFENVDWAPFEAEVNTLYNMEGRGRRPKPSLAYLKAVLVKMLFEINSFSKLVQRLRNNPDPGLPLRLRRPTVEVGVQQIHDEALRGRAGPEALPGGPEAAQGGRAEAPWQA